MWRAQQYKVIRYAGVREAKIWSLRTYSLCYPYSPLSLPNHPVFYRLFLFVSLFILLLRYWTLLGWLVRTLIPELKNGPNLTARDENRKTSRGTDPGRWMRLGVRVGTEAKRGRGEAGEILNSCHEDRNFRKKMFLWVMQSDFSLYQKTWVKNNIAVSALGSPFVLVFHNPRPQSTSTKKMRVDLEVGLTGAST